MTALLRLVAKKQQKTVLLKPLLTSLVKEGGINPSDITVYDVSHLFPDYMVKMCAEGELKGIQFVGRNRRLTKSEMGIYSPLVDLMANTDLGGKTVLYILDALICAPSEGASITVQNSKWQQAPFNSDYTSSIFVSQDPVAINGNARKDGNKIGRYRMKRFLTFLLAVAKHIEKNVSADIYKITPEVSYTSANLNYNDSSTRTTKEQHDTSARSAISGAAENMSGYDIVFLGYPIW